MSVCLFVCRFVRPSVRPSVFRSLFLSKVCSWSVWLVGCLFALYRFPAALLSQRTVMLNAFDGSAPQESQAQKAHT
jgi:hypothetical protein